MSELGQILKQARKERGLSLEQLEQKTKIRKRYLEAIEEQNFSVLPGSFYVRAFIKNYAEAVGLNPEEILRLYGNVLPQNEPPSKMDGVASRKQKRSVNFEKVSKWAAGILMISFLLLIIILIYMYYVNRDSPSDHTLNETPLTSELNGGNHEPGDSNETVGQDPPDISDREPDLEQDPDDEPDVPPEPETAEPELTLVNTDDSTVDIYTLSNTDHIEAELSITGVECWVEVHLGSRPNGEELLRAMMYEGDTESFEVNDSINFYMGFPRAAEITIFGETLTFEGSSPRSVQINLVGSST